MAKLIRTLHGSLQTILNVIDRELLEGSVSATFEDGYDTTVGDCQCAVRVYERFSYAGGNRVSMNITLVGKGDQWKLCAITSGGSQALFFKINTLGEDAFLDKLAEILDRL